MSYNEGKMGMNNPTLDNRRKWCTLKCHVLSLEKDLWSIDSLAKWARMLVCDPLDGKNSIVEHLPQIFSLECTNHNKLATLHLEYVNCLVLLTTCMQSFFLKFWECRNLVLNAWCEHKLHFLHEHEKFIFIEMSVFDVHAKFVLNRQLLIRVNTLTRAPNTTKTWPLPTLTYFYTFKSSSHCIICVSVHRYPCWLGVIVFFFYCGRMNWVELM